LGGGGSRTHAQVSHQMLCIGTSRKRGGGGTEKKFRGLFAIVPSIRALDHSAVYLRRKKKGYSRLTKLPSGVAKNPTGERKVKEKKSLGRGSHQGRYLRKE